jgi:hypothetical protein
VLGHYGELSLQNFFVFNPLLQFLKAIYQLEHAPNDVNDSKVSTDWYVDVFDIFMFGKHESTFTCLQEIDVIDLIFILIYILHFLDQHGLQHGTEPSFERITPLLQEKDLLVSLLMQVQAHLNF